MSEQRQNAAAADKCNSLRCAGFASMLLVSAGFLAGCTSKPPAPPPPQPLPVTTVQLEPTDVPITGEWVGTLDGYVNAQIQPQANGYLIKQNYREGARRYRRVRFSSRLIHDLSRQRSARHKGNLAQAKGAGGAGTGTARSCRDQRKTRYAALAEARAIAQSQLDNDTQQKAQQEGMPCKSAQASVAAAQANGGQCAN